MPYINKSFPIVPSDVFGMECTTHAGYARESFTITVGADKVVRVGTLLEVDYAAKTATMLTAPADAAAVAALGDLAVFFGRDLPVQPVTAQDFENLTMTETGVGVAITRGDGSGMLKKGYLDLDGTAYYDLPEDVIAALDAKFTKENRFKVVEQQRPASL